MQPLVAERGEDLKRVVAWIYGLDVPTEDQDRIFEMVAKVCLCCADAVLEYRDQLESNKQKKLPHLTSANINENSTEITDNINNTPNTENAENAETHREHGHNKKQRAYGTGYTFFPFAAFWKLSAMAIC